MRNRKGIKQLIKAGCMSALCVLASVGACWGQSSGFRVGVLTAGLTYDPVFQGMTDGLERLGYRPEKNLSFTVEDSKGNLSDLAGRAKRLVDAKPDALFTVGTAHSLAAKQATSSVPLVFALVADPVRSGLIAGYQSSKNNLTGVATYAGSLSGKRLEMLKEMAPATKRVLVLVAPAEGPARDSLLEVEDAAKKLRMQIVLREVTSRADIEKVLADQPKGSVDAIFFFPSTLVGANIGTLITKAKENKIPLVVLNERMVTQGALFGYGSDFRVVGTQAARLMAKVLKGEKPSDIPTETPEKFLLAVNLTVAKAIGLKIPRAVLERVDRVVE